MCVCVCMYVYINDAPGNMVDANSVQIWHIYAQNPHICPSCIWHMCAIWLAYLFLACVWQ